MTKLQLNVIFRSFNRTDNRTRILYKGVSVDGLVLDTLSLATVLAHVGVDVANLGVIIEWIFWNAIGMEDRRDVSDGIKGGGSKGCFWWN